MKSIWLGEKNNHKKLIFFHGWGMDHTTLSHLSCGDIDVLVCYDYSELTLNETIKELLEGDFELKIAAWSLGVMAAAKLLAPLQIKDAVAINGTLTPVDAQYGIAPNVFSGTIDNWLEESARANFYRRVGGSVLTKRDAKEQQQELEIMNETAKIPTPNIYSRAIIGERDRIFCAKNQINAWEKASVPYTTLPKIGHNYLATLNSWQEVFNA